MRTYVAAVAALALVGAVVPVGETGEVDAGWRVPTEIRVAGRMGLGTSEAVALQAELDAYAAMPWHNVTVVYEEYHDLGATISGPNPPDIVLVPQPAALREHADELFDLDRYVWERRLRHDYGDYLIDQVSVDDQVLGIPVKADLKSLVWYRPDTFVQHGYAVPQTFTELVALSDRMVADNETPWCAYMESGGATGWVGTDWIEDLFLSAEGPTAYDQWVAHTRVFQDPTVEAAFDRFQTMMDTPGYVYDRPSILDVSFADNALPLAEGDCLMHKQASFFSGFIGGAGLDPADFATFRFPPVDPAYADAVVGGAGNYVAVVNPSWDVRWLVRFMASPRFGARVIAGSDAGWILPNRRFELDRYTEDLTRTMAETLQAGLASGQFRFDASDLMPSEVGAIDDVASFWVGVRDLLNGDRTVPEVLYDIDVSWPS